MAKTTADKRFERVIGEDIDEWADIVRGRITQLGDCVEAQRVAQMNRGEAKAVLAQLEKEIRRLTQLLLDEGLVP